MDFSTLTDDQLADAQKALLDELHARVDGLEAPAKGRFQRALRTMHVAADALKELATGAGIITPYSGGDPKP